MARAKAINSARARETLRNYYKWELLPGSLCFVKVRSSLELLALSVGRVWTQFQLHVSPEALASPAGQAGKLWEAQGGRGSRVGCAAH